MMAKHRRLGRRRPTLWRRCLVDIVDVRSLLTHLMTPEAAAEGRRGRYLALCGGRRYSGKPHRARTRPLRAMRANVRLDPESKIGGRPVSAMKAWCLRSTRDLTDAHLLAEEMTESGDGTVESVCGARFQQGAPEELRHRHDHSRL